MIRLNKNNQGFTHLLIMLAVSVLVAGGVGYSGYRVVKQNRTTDNTAKSSTNNSDATVKTRALAAENTAASDASASGTAPQEIALLDRQYDLSTPQGSLNHLIRLMQAKDFGSSLYFITPRFMFKSADALKVNYPVTYQDCQNRTECLFVLGLNINDIDTNQLYENGQSPGGTRAVYLSFSADLKDGKVINQHPRYGGKYSFKVYMFETSDHWVVDKVIVNGKTI